MNSKRDAILKLIEKSMAWVFNPIDIPFTKRSIIIIENDCLAGEAEALLTELIAQIDSAIEEETSSRVVSFTSKLQRENESYLRQITDLHDRLNYRDRTVEDLRAKLEHSVNKNVEYMEIVDRLTDIKKPG